MTIDCRATPTESLTTALHLLTVEELKQRVEKLPGNNLGNAPRKIELVQALERNLSGPVLEQTWRLLSEIERSAVSDALYHRDNRLDIRQFNAKHGPLALADLFDTNGLPVGRAWLFLYRKIGHTRQFIVPGDLKEHLRTLVPPPPASKIETIDAPPESVRQITLGPRGGPGVVSDIPLVRRDMEITAQHDLLAVLRLIGAGGVTVSEKTGRATALSTRRVAAVLQGDDFYASREHDPDASYPALGPFRAYAWPLLVRAGKLVRRRGTKLELTRSGHAALAAAPAATLRNLWSSWLGNKLLDEFTRIDTIKGQRGKGRRGMTPAPDRRNAIVGALAACSVGEWIRFGDFSRFMLAEDMTFKVTERPWLLYIGDRRYGDLGRLHHLEWELLQTRYLICFLFEYTATLGLIDIAYRPPEFARDDFRAHWAGEELHFLSRYDGLEYLRINTLGAYCLELDGTYEPSRPTVQTSFSILPNLTIRVSGTPGSDEQILLERYAMNEADDLWQLDAEKVLTALESGSNIDELRSFLASRDDQPLPEMVEGFLTRMERRAGAIRPRGTALLFECASAGIADQIASDKQIAKLCTRSGTRLLVVAQASEKKFRTAVRALGFGIPPG